MGWKDKYQVVGIVPGRVITKANGEVNLADEDLPVELIDGVFASGSAYLKLKPTPKPAKKQDEDETK